MKIDTSTSLSWDIKTHFEYKQPVALVWDGSQGNLSWCICLHMWGWWHHFKEDLLGKSFDCLRKTQCKYIQVANLMQVILVSVHCKWIDCNNQVIVVSLFNEQEIIGQYLHSACGVVTWCLIFNALLSSNMGNITKIV